MTTTERERARWRHEWHPLNWPAALLKAHHSRQQARRLLEAERGRPVDHGHPLLPPPSAPPAPAPPPAQAAGTTASRHKAVLRDLADEELSARLGDTDDEAVIGRIVAELARRDREDEKAVQAQAKRDRAKARRDKAAEDRDTEYAAHVEAGRDPEEAFEDVYGVTILQQRKAAAMSSMRGRRLHRQGLPRAGRRRVQRPRRAVLLRGRGCDPGPHAQPCREAPSRRSAVVVHRDRSPGAQVRLRGAAELLAAERPADRGRLHRFGGWRQGPLAVDGLFRMTASTSKLAAEMGARAGRRFLAEGIMPRCPFHKHRPELALAWMNAATAVIAEALRPAVTP
jgi:hypothetical protein